MTTAMTATAMAAMAIAEDDGWANLEKGITKLLAILDGHGGAFTVDEWMDMYTLVYDLCLRQPVDEHQRRMYQLYNRVFADYTADVTLPSVEHKQHESLLRELVLRWSNHKVIIRWLSRFFDYLNRYYVTAQKIPTLQEAGSNVFRTHVFAAFKQRAQDAILRVIDRERNGESVDRHCLQSAVEWFADMDAYTSDFEPALLNAAATFYQRQASTWIERSCPDFMLNAETSMRAEKERSDHYLHATSEPKLLQVVDAEVLTAHHVALLSKDGSGVRALLRDDKRDDLARMFRLFHRLGTGTPGLAPIAEAFRKHVEEKGMVLLRAAEDKRSTQWEPTLIREVMALHDQSAALASTCFQRHALFNKALAEAFDVFCNKTVALTSFAELLSTFLDNLLKKGSTERMNDDAMDATMDKTTQLLCYVIDKDLFQEFYRKRLARRLLTDNSASDDHERSLLSKLKHQFGTQFTSKMEGMLSDLAVGRHAAGSPFDEWFRSKGAPLDMQVTVLNTGFWPTYKFADLALTHEMVRGVEAFKEFYESTTKQRKLTWIYALGSCVVHAKTDKWKGELTVTTAQAAVLNLFNDRDTATLAEVRDELRLSNEDAARTLHSLACAKYALLRKSPAGNTVAATDVFQFNAAFENRARRIKMVMPPMDEKKKVIADVASDRRYVIDAAIVRIMKSRRTMQHQQLVLECVSQLAHSFKPDLKVVKMRIEDLIAREFMQRDADNPSVFQYIA